MLIVERGVGLRLLRDATGDDPVLVEEPVAGVPEDSPEIFSYGVIDFWCIWSWKRTVLPEHWLIIGIIWIVLGNFLVKNVIWPSFPCPMCSSFVSSSIV